MRAEGRDYSYGFLPKCPGPKLFISGDHDEFGPREMVDEVLGRAAEPTEIHWVAGADHFFQGTADSPGAKLGQMQEIMRDWLLRMFGLS